jgi:carbamoyltransferase
MIDACTRYLQGRRLEPNKRIRPRHPTFGKAGFRAGRWLGARLMAAAGFHQLGSEFANARIAQVHDKLGRGEAVYLAGLGLPGTHNSGVALVEVTQANGPRLIVNNEEERFSGNKHTTEYPQASIEAMVKTLRGMGRDIGDIAAWLTSWDYHARQLGLLERVPLICMPHHDNHAWFSFAASPFAENEEAVAISVLDGTGDLGSISLYVVENGEMRQLYCNESMSDSLGAFYSVISSTQGGWTWLSSEGRYMGAAAWGDMNRATNPRLKNILHFGHDGEIRLNRSLANWYCDPFDHPYKPALIEILGEPLKPGSALESRRGSARRGHQAPAGHTRPSRQSRRDAARVRGCDDPCGRSSLAYERREQAGAYRRGGVERSR